MHLSTINRRFPIRFPWVSGKSLWAEVVYECYQNANVVNYVREAPRSRMTWIRWSFIRRKNGRYQLALFSIVTFATLARLWLGTRFDLGAWRQQLDPKYQYFDKCMKSRVSVNSHIYVCNIFLSFYILICQTFRRYTHHLWGYYT